MTEEWAGSLLVLALALAVDAALGYPPALFRAIGHPVTWFGRLISMLDRRLNRDEEPFERRLATGACATVLLAAVAILGGAIVQAILGLFGSAVGTLTVAFVASTLLAQRSLDDHVRAVADALEDEGLEAGRASVAMIVGRDPDRLDEAGVCRAAIESLAESASDGVVAPALFIALGGLAGGAVYKAVNTADSMIGHRTERHEAFGWAAARLDDLLNLPAARLTALMLIVAAALMPDASGSRAARTAWRDAGKHKSPNAGWPEAAMAGALGLKLGGPRVYDGHLVDAVSFGDGRFEANPYDVRRALRIWRLAMLLQFVAVSALAAWVATD